jgi:hypothetical protein
LQNRFEPAHENCALREQPSELGPTQSGCVIRRP